MIEELFAETVLRFGFQIIGETSLILWWTCYLTLKTLLKSQEILSVHGVLFNISVLIMNSCMFDIVMETNSCWSSLDLCTACVTVKQMFDDLYSCRFCSRITLPFQSLPIILFVKILVLVKFLWGRAYCGRESLFITSPSWW